MNQTWSERKSAAKNDERMALETCCISEMLLHWRGRRGRSAVQRCVCCFDFCSIDLANSSPARRISSSVRSFWCVANDHR